MKWILILLILFSSKSYAQLIMEKQAKAFSGKLVENGFLTLKGQQVLFEEFKKGNLEVNQPSTVRSVTYSRKALSKETILQFCHGAIATELMRRLDEKGFQIEEKISPKEPLDDTSERAYSVVPGFGGGRKEYVGCIAPQTSVFGYTRAKTLNTFLETGLIDEKIFKDCEAAVSSKRLRDEVDLIKYMLDRSTHYTYYEFNKAEQESFIAYLVEHNILTEQGKQTLLKSYKDFELKSIPEILQQSPRYTLVDLHSYEPDPKITYPVIFDAFKKSYPPFKYSNLSVEIIEEKEDDLIRQDIRLSFNIDTIRYVHSFFHDYKKQNPEPGYREDEISRVDQDFHKGVNKWLTDMESSFRLYIVTVLDKDEITYGHRSVGLLLLKQGEDSLITADPYLLSRESFDQRLSRKNIEKLLNDFHQKKFFTHLTPAQIDSAKLRIASEEINAIEAVLLQFPKTIVVFDWETGNLENPYEELTKKFMDASRGAFTVSNIIDEYEKGWKKAKKVKYGFTMNGKKYVKMLRFKDDWLDPEFFELLKSALKENKVDGDIYYCVDNGQEAGYIFLTAEQYQFVKEAYSDLLKEL